MPCRIRLLLSLLSELSKLSKPHFHTARASGGGRYCQNCHKYYVLMTSSVTVRGSARQTPEGMAQRFAREAPGIVANHERTEELA